MSYELSVPEDVVLQEYLGLTDTDLKNLVNPFKLYAGDDVEPLEEMLSLMSDPRYFYFTCKEILNIDLAPFQLVILQELWHKKYPMLIATRGAGKSFLLAVYAILRSLLNQGSKTILVGSGFRSSKILFNYIHTIWEGAPVLRDICRGRSGPHKDADMWTFVFGDSVVMAVPIGHDGEKIRGLRATNIICDESKSQNKEVFDTVVKGFASVKASPVEGMKEAARARVLKNRGKYNPDLELLNMGNQTILAGTTYFRWNWFYSEWRKYKAIIESHGDIDKLRTIFPQGIPSKFDWRNYGIIRIPFELIPEGYMDEETVAGMQATVGAATYISEYGAGWPTDTNGFFPRSLIEKCVTTKPVRLSDGREVQFYALIKGNKNKRYVIGIDPAAHADNCGIVVLELNGNHSRVVYCWTTNMDEHKKRIEDGVTQEKDYYQFIAAKIRELHQIFPTDRIVMDAQGGGDRIAEALHDKDKINPGHGQELFWPIIDPENEKPTDDEAGLHIIELVQFASSAYTSFVNHGLKGDMGDKTLLFPVGDAIALAEVGETSMKLATQGRDYDTLEECILEIEELKNELTTIIQTETQSGREKWDTPELKISGSKKGRMRKDRYSALVMANGAARKMLRADEAPDYLTNGGMAIKERNASGYIGPNWFTEKVANVDFSGKGVRVSRITI